LLIYSKSFDDPADIRAYPDQPSLSLDMISELYSELRAYLIPLVHHLITLVENQQAQLPLSRRNAEVHRTQVYQTLSFRGEDYPNIVLAEYTEEETLSYQRKGRLGVMVDPPRGLSWRQMEMEMARPVEEDARGDSDLETTVTDEEDEELDVLLGNLDEAFDEVYAGGLWDAAKENGDMEELNNNPLGKPAEGISSRVLAARQGERMVRRTCLSCSVYEQSSGHWQIPKISTFNEE
jgi:hypothetical protein